jgi:fibronectin type 3 domain-containing protein
VEWQTPTPASDGDLPEYYGIYRSTGPSIDVNDAEQLIHITIGPVTEFYDTSVDSGVSYRYGVAAYDDGDNEGTASVTSVEMAHDGQLPLSTVLLQNYPNPFNARTTITFRLAEESRPTSLKIFNVAGQEVVTLLDGALRKGQHQVVWSGKNSTGEEVASGIYFYHLQTGDWQQAKRMILIR